LRRKKENLSFWSRKGGVELWGRKKMRVLRKRKKGGRSSKCPGRATSEKKEGRSHFTGKEKNGPKRKGSGKRERESSVTLPPKTGNRVCVRGKRGFSPT